MIDKELRSLGFPKEVILKAIHVLESEYRKLNIIQIRALMKRVVTRPAFYKDHPKLGTVAKELIKKTYRFGSVPKKIRSKSSSYPIYGEEGIDTVARQQMDVAMKLPITISGALMPDAHPGYGLPIGGVLASDNAVIPYGVGVDIGCRMRISAYDLPIEFLDQNREQLKTMLVENTRFGRAVFTKPRDHPVLERQEFKEIKVLRELLDRASDQIGTSGGGNHFVEFGILEIPEFDDRLGLQPGKYMALLSHSGSRGMGAEIARHYTRLAQQICELPGEARQLAWLTLDSEEGQEYWKAMNLAGDYASACHQQIHERFAQALAEEPLATVENHHNFAWKESDDAGNEIIVHRKGATPAGKNVLGVIPGTMTSPGFIVRGKGDVKSINSAAHGAGRVMSRREARRTFTHNEVARHLKKAGVDVIGSGLDEAPMVYKDIYQVMKYQKDLVEVVGMFWPKVVRMCGDKKYVEVD